MMFLIAYLVIYMLAIASLSLIKGDLDDPIFVDFLKLQPANVMSMVLIFISLQGRELRRFNDQYKIYNAQSQVRSIFNMSSDAILVVKTKIKEKYASNED